MLRLAVIAVVLAGCHVVFGLDDVRPPPDAPDAPSDTLLVTGSYKLLYLTNDASFAPVVNERIYAPGTISIAVTLADGTQPDVTYNADGTFSFARAYAGQPYRFVLTADGSRAQIQQRAPVLDFVGMLAGRPDRLPLAQTFVQFAYPTVAGTQAAMVWSTGTFTQTSTALGGPTVTFDWRLSAPAPGAVVGMLEAAQHDQIIAIEPETDSSIAGLSFTTIKALSKASISQMAAGTVVIPGPQPITRSNCVRFSAPNGAEYNRIAAAAPRTYLRSSADWHVYMSPLPSLMGNTGALWVAICGFTPARDIDIAPTFHDPFVGRTLVIETASAGVFDLKLGSNTPAQMVNINRRYAMVERGNASACTSTHSVIPGTVALATSFVIDGMPLDTDAKVVPLDLTRQIPFTWTLTPGPVEHSTVTVYEIYAVNGATATVVRDATAVAGQTSAMLDPTLFVPGHTYAIAVTTSIGRPNAETGDWRTLQMPFENATIWSRYFTAEAR